jgi:hypothetical protein
MAQDDVHETRTLMTDFAPPTAAIMFQADPVILNFQELLVEREEFRGIEVAGREQLLLGMREHFFAMAEKVARHRQIGTETLP